MAVSLLKNEQTVACYGWDDRRAIAQTHALHYHNYRQV